MGFSKWPSEIVHEIEYLVFHNYFFLGGGIFFPDIHVFLSDQFSFLMYRYLLPSSVSVKMDYEKSMENARYATNDDTPL